jgi:hypothetical protein
MMSNQIPGVPEGWEVERIGKPIFNVDHVIHYDGQPMLCDYDSSYLNRVIIRKIEKPAAYRPFKDAAEFKPHRDRWIRRKDNGHEMRTTSFCDSVHFTGNDGEAWETMLADYIFDDDGTPFGVRIDE